MIYLTKVEANTMSLGVLCTRFNPKKTCSRWRKAATDFSLHFQLFFSSKLHLIKIKFRAHQLFDQLPLRTNSHHITLPLETNQTASKSRTQTNSNQLATFQISTT